MAHDEKKMADDQPEEAVAEEETAEAVPMEEGNAGRSFSSLKANPNRISITTCLEGDRAVVKIADNGVGMAQKIRRRIFGDWFLEVFFSREATDSESQ